MEVSMWARKKLGEILLNISWIFWNIGINIESGSNHSISSICNCSNIIGKYHSVSNHQDRKTNSSQLFYHNRLRNSYRNNRKNFSSIHSTNSCHNINNNDPHNNHTLFNSRSIRLAPQKQASSKGYCINENETISHHIHSKIDICRGTSYDYSQKISKWLFYILSTAYTAKYPEKRLTDDYHSLHHAIKIGISNNIFSYIYCKRE